MMPTTVGEATITQRPERYTLGIRVQTPMKGMFAVVDQLRKELNGWLKQNGVEPGGPPFLRYYVIDMAGEMDVEYGVQVAAPLDGDERVRPGVLPAGRYVSLIYVGHGLTGNKALIGYIEDNNLAVDRWETARGDAFRCRTETYLTDPTIEHRKSKWDVEVAIKLADD